MSVTIDENPEDVAAPRSITCAPGRRRMRPRHVDLGDTVPADHYFRVWQRPRARAVYERSGPDDNVCVDRFAAASRLNPRDAQACEA